MKNRSAVLSQVEGSKASIVHTFIKYLLFQIPQWLVLGLFLWFLVDRTAVPPWAGVGFFIFWFAKDLAMYPFVRRAYENNAKTGAEALIAGRGVARERLDPQGYIKIHGELWKARTKDQPIAEDSAVKVTGANGMILVVEPADGDGESRRQRSELRSQRSEVGLRESKTCPEQSRRI